MKTLLINLVTPFIALLAFSQNNGSIVSASQVVYPAYETIKGMPVYYNKDEYLESTTSKTFKTEKITYYSDDLKVVAYLATPRTIARNRKYPVIIFNRGSFVRNDIAFVHAPLFKKFVDSGFIVIAPALRESEGGEGKDEMGGNDLHDIWNVLPLVRSKNYIDTTNLFMFGESRGGVMTLELLRAGFPVNAAATVGAFTDFDLFIKENPGMENLCSKIWPGYAENKDSIITARSAIKWADQINTDLLIMAGSKDRSVNPHHSIQLADQLNNFHKTYQLLILNGGNHILSGACSYKRDAEIIAWFRQHIRK